MQNRTFYVHVDMSRKWQSNKPTTLLNPLKDVDYLVNLFGNYHNFTMQKIGTAKDLGAKFKNDTLSSSKTLVHSEMNYSGAKN